MPIVTEDWQIRDILAQVRRIAVIGLSPNTARPSNEVAQAMQAEGYGIVPVNPSYDKVLGHRSYPDLRYISTTVNMVDVFRHPRHVPDIVEICIERGIRNLWLQEGVIHEDAAERAANAGIHVVMDRCMLKEYRRLLG